MCAPLFVVNVNKVVVVHFPSKHYFYKEKNKYFNFSGPKIGM